MQQPWEEPAEPIEQAADSLPLAGLLAELLAGAEAQGVEQALPAGAREGNGAPAPAARAWFDQPASDPMKVADLMRALGEAEQERQAAATGSFPPICSHD